MEKKFIVDKNYCMSSFLQFRYVFNNKIFSQGLIPNYQDTSILYKIKDAEDLDYAIKDYIKKNVDDKTVLMLSGGMDSSLLARYLPKNTMTFTLKTVADGPTIDETKDAKRIANLNGLRNKVIHIYWSDYEKYIPIILKNKKAPFHSIEVQIYKAAKIAKNMGYEKLLFAESADCVFGGLDKLLSQDWKFDDFVKRYNYVNPADVLKKPKLILEPYNDCKLKDSVDVHKFLSTYFYIESANSYLSATQIAGIKYLSPFTAMKLDTKLDLDKIRNNNSKYLIRELVKQKYNEIIFKPKTPMPRPMNLWLKGWKGPSRDEFKKDSITTLSGDQKWLVYILEKFLDYYEVS